MKKSSSSSVRVVVAASVLLVVGGWGCNRTPSPPLVRVTKTTPIEFTFPDKWYENAGQHPYDLQVYGPRRQAVFGVFAFTADELKAGQSRTDFYRLQIDDLKGKRDNMTIVVPESVRNTADKSITTVVYRGKKDGEEHYYAFLLFEFKADPTRFAVAIQTCVPDNWDRYRPEFEQIGDSARLLPSEKSP